jgi:hypothetical protein
LATTKTVKARKAKKPVVESESDDDKANDNNDKGNGDTSPKPALAVSDSTCSFCILIC